MRLTGTFGPGELEERLAASLGERFRLEGEFARGGTATVYRARDLVRDEAVAVKLLHPRLASGIGAERFLREIALCRSLDHPHIVPLVHSAGAGDLFYYVMPYIGGGSLHTRLSRDGRLPVLAALRIAGELAQALGYAHRRGILHRDLKPENVLLGEAGAMVADFGLARVIGTEHSRLTETGVIVGTVLYMSPEHLCDDPGLDGRSDVYSLGCLLFEMVCGVPPFTAATLTELAGRILRAPAPSVRTLCPELPAGLEGIIQRALAKSPAARYASMDDLGAALAASIEEQAR